MAETARDVQPPETIVTLPLGDAGIHFTGEPNTEHLLWGPTALAVAPDGSFLIADAVVTRIVQVGRDGALGRPIDLSGKVVGMADLAVTDRAIYVLDLSAVVPQVVALARDGSGIDAYPLPAGLAAEATGVALGRQGELELELGAGRYQLLDARGALDPRPARGPAIEPGADDDSVTVAGRRIKVRRRAGVSYRFLGEIGADVVVVAEETQLTERDGIHVEQTVSRHTDRGDAVGIARAPTPFIPTPNGLAIGADGAIFVLTTTPRGAVIQRLPWLRELPVTADVGGQAVTAERSVALSSVVILRTQIIATADAFLNNGANLSAANINGTAAPPARSKPHYLGAPGVYSSVPYQWGGFDTAATFNDEMAQSQAAGDVNCVGNVKPGTAGADCSGFVSRCWGLPAKHSTDTLPSVAIPLAGIDDCQPGDILNSPSSLQGHVRLVHRLNPDGTVQVFEATTFDNRDRVINRKILRSGFAGYTPYRYERVLDTPRSTGHRYFPETGHFIDFGFRDFFETHGDVPILGFPLSEEFDEACDDGVTRTVQYFERAVFEFHTGGAPVLLRLLGPHERERRYPGGQNLPAAFQPLAAPPAQGRYFPETQHHIDFGFRAFYEAQPDALFVFGFPLSEEFTETCDDNVQRTVQYFERAVFEFHGGATPVLARLLGPHERERRYPGGVGLPVQFLRRRADGSIE